VTNIRMKIAAGATILGLGGLAGFAMGSSPSADPQSIETTATQARPKVRTQVVRRTVHVRPKSKDTKPSASAAGAATAGPAAMPPASAPAAPSPAATPVSSSSPPPVSTGTSGSTGAGTGSDYDDEQEVEREDEHEDEGGDD
jgi:hypothetical protein